MPRYAPPTSYCGRDYVLTATVHVEPFRIDNRDLKHVHVDVRWAEREEVAKTLAGTVDNRDGYGNVEAAQRVARDCANLLAQGVTATYDLATWSDRTAGVTLSWQQYDDERYCTDARVLSSGRDNIGAWEVRIGLVRWLEKLAGGRLDDPRTLLTTLRRKKAVALLPWRERTSRYGEGTRGGGWVAADWDTVLASLPVAARAASEAA
jgi:hypothetical protein